MIAGLVQNARFVINNIPVQLLPPPHFGSRIEVASHGTLLQRRVCPCLMQTNTNHNCHYRGELLVIWSEHISFKVCFMFSLLWKDCPNSVFVTLNYFFRGDFLFTAC